MQNKRGFMLFGTFNTSEIASIRQMILDKIRSEWNGFTDLTHIDLICGSKEDRAKAQDTYFKNGLLERLECDIREFLNDYIDVRLNQLAFEIKQLFNVEVFRYQQKITEWCNFVQICQAANSTSFADKMTDFDESTYQDSKVILKSTPFFVYSEFADVNDARIAVHRLNIRGDYQTDLGDLLESHNIENAFIPKPVYSTHETIFRRLKPGIDGYIWLSLCEKSYDIMNRFVQIYKGCAKTTTDCITEMHAIINNYVDKDLVHPYGQQDPQVVRNDKEASDQYTIATHVLDKLIALFIEQLSYKESVTASYFRYAACQHFLERECSFLAERMNLQKERLERAEVMIRPNATPPDPPIKTLMESLPTGYLQDIDKLLSPELDKKLIDKLRSDQYYVRILMTLCLAWMSEEKKVTKRRSVWMVGPANSGKTTWMNLLSRIFTSTRCRFESQYTMNEEVDSMGCPKTAQLVLLNELPVKQFHVAHVDRLKEFLEGNGLLINPKYSKQQVIYQGAVAMIATNALPSQYNFGQDAQEHWEALCARCYFIHTESLPLNQAKGECPYLANQVAKDLYLVYVWIRKGSLLAESLKKHIENEKCQMGPATNKHKDLRLVEKIEFPIFDQISPINKPIRDECTIDNLVVDFSYLQSLINDKIDACSEGDSVRDMLQISNLTKKIQSEIIKMAVTQGRSFSLKPETQMKRRRI